MEIRSSAVATSVRRLQLRLVMLWSGAWILGIGVFALVAVAVGGSRHRQDLQDEMALYAMALFGLGWFSDDGLFHDELIQLEPGLVDGPFDLWVVGTGDPARVHLEPEVPGIQVESWSHLVDEVLASRDDVLREGVSLNGVPYRVHAAPTYVDVEGGPGDGDEDPIAAIIVAADSRPASRSDAAFATQVLALAIGLGLTGLALGVVMARHSLRPVVTAFEQRERFLAAAAHELRTPIASLQAVCESASAGDESADVALGRIGPLVARTGSVVNDLLLHARLEAGAATLERRSLRLDLLVETCLPEGDSVQFTASESVIEADDMLLQVALRNLIENSAIHGEGKGLSVSVSDHGVVVEDEGPGYPDAILALGAEASPLAPSSHGTGIGLATCRMIARLHGGDLELSNRPAGGARAVLRLGA